MTKGQIYFLTGAPGVGKTTTAEAIANRFERAVLLDLDTLRQRVVKGLSQPSVGWSDETTLQFHLAHVDAGQAAEAYSGAGFTVVIAHCSSPESIKTFLEHAGNATVICLKAELPTNLKRNNERTNKSFDPQDIEHFVHSLADKMPIEHHEAGFAVLDNTHKTIEDVVDEILSLRRLF